jgi:hypothetical protein
VGLGVGVAACRSQFQIVSFGSSFSMLFPDGGAVYSEETLAEATRHITGVSANMGGTEILQPLEAVFSRGGNRNKPLQLFLFTGTTASL